MATVELFKSCPLLVQRDTRKSYTVEGESYTNTCFSKCLGVRCAAFDGGNCKMFGTSSMLPQPNEEYE